MFLACSWGGMQTWRCSDSLGPMLGIPLRIRGPPCPGIRVFSGCPGMWFQPAVLFRHRIDSTGLGGPIQLDILWPVAFLSGGLLCLGGKWRVTWTCLVTYAKLFCCISQRLPWVVWILSQAIWSPDLSRPGQEPKCILLVSVCHRFRDLYFRGESKPFLLFHLWRIFSVPYCPATCCIVCPEVWSAPVHGLLLGLSPCIGSLLASTCVGIPSKVG